MPPSSPRHGERTQVRGPLRSLRSLLFKIRNVPTHARQRPLKIRIPNSAIRNARTSTPPSSTRSTTSPPPARTPQQHSSPSSASPISPPAPNFELEKNNET